MIRVSYRIFQLGTVIISRNLCLHGNDKGLVTTHGKRHVHEWHLGNSQIFIKTIKHIPVMYPPFETVLDSLSRKIILGNHTLETHSHVRTEATKIKISGIIKTGGITFRLKIQRETGLFISLVRIFQHGYIRISGETADYPQYSPI